jgi:isopentenyl-diphosphate delta-isomerase
MSAEGILEQAKFMNEEYVILVDKNDKAIGRETKLGSHHTKVIAEGMLHRAFSVILFNSKNELLIQQRAGIKPTFPLFWANTCCSHPLDNIPEETIEENAMGVKTAACRKVIQELGIKDLKPTDLTFTTKLHYEAAQDAVWSEHEIDWLLIAKREVELDVNPNECEAIRWVSKDELKQLLQDAIDGKEKVAAWFHLMSEKFLFPWWDRIDEIRALDRLPEDLSQGLPAVTYLGTPMTQLPAKHFYPDVEMKY